MAATATTTTAALSFLSSLLFSLNESPLYHHHPIMLFFALLFLFTFSLLSLVFLFYFLFNGFHLKKTGQKTKTQTQTQTQTRTQPDQSVFTFSSSKTSEKTHESNPTHLTHSLLLEFLPSNSPKWGSLFQTSGCGTDPVTDGSGLNLDLDRDLGVENRVNKKKKKRAKKKKLNSNEENGVVEEKGGEAMDELGLKESQELVCMFPFTTSSSVIQRKIKQQFDQLVKCHESKELTLAQVGQFANCLIEVKQELEHKSEVIQRKFTITKALLYKADRSSFDRLCQQIHKLEMEQKRLEEDAFVYNLLQQQLKLSPAYKKILEISARLELKANSGELMESADDTEFSEMSFEELLAREKMDSFWQKNRKSKSCST